MVEDDMRSSTHTNMDDNNQEGEGSNARAADPQIMSGIGSLYLEGNGEENKPSCNFTDYGRRRNPPAGSDSHRSYLQLTEDNIYPSSPAVSESGSSNATGQPKHMSPSPLGSRSMLRLTSAVSSSLGSVWKNVKKLLPPFGSKSMVKKSRSDYQFPKGASLKQPRRVESDSDLSVAKNTKQLEELGAYSMPVPPIDSHLGPKQQQICKEEDLAHSLGYPQVTTVGVQPAEEYGRVDETAAVPEETDALPIAPDDINTPFKGDVVIPEPPEPPEEGKLKDSVSLPTVNIKKNIAPRSIAVDNIYKGMAANSHGTSAEHFDNQQHTCSHLQSAGTSFQDLPPDYDQFIGDLEEALKDFENLKCPIYCPAPDDYHKLLLQDPEITEAKDAIKTLGNKYPRYEIILSGHLKPIRMTSGKMSRFPNYTSSLYSTPPQMPCRVSRTLVKDTYDSHIATVGVFVEKAPSDKLELVLGVTAAHAILEDDEMDDISYAETPDSTKTQTLALMRSTIGGRIQYDEDVTVGFPDNEPAPVRDRVYVASTKFICTSEEGLFSHQKFLLDIALLPVDPKILHPDLAKDREQRNVALASIPQQKRLSDEGTPQRERLIDGYIDIQNEHDIDRLRVKNVSIQCENFIGKLAVHPKSFGAPHRKWRIAPHFAFTLKDKDLLGGHSGSPVLVYNKNKKVYHVIGIFSGKFRGKQQWSHKALYQATPYGPALKQLQFLYDTKLGDVKPVVGDAGGFSVEESLPSLAQY